MKEKTNETWHYSWHVFYSEVRGKQHKETTVICIASFALFEHAIEFLEGKGELHDPVTLVGENMCSCDHSEFFD